MKPKTLKQLKGMSDVEIVDYSLLIYSLHKDGSKESEYVFERMTRAIEEQ